MSVETIARRYASALADVVVKSGQTSTVQTELKTWEEMMTSNNELFEAFRNPSISHLNKESLLDTLIERTRPSQTTSNFLRVLLRNSRLTALADINKRFVVELDEREGISSAEVISARELNAAEKAELQARVEGITGRTVKMEFNIDENIIGGVVTRIGSTVYDGSVRTQLENLRHQLTHG